MRFARLIVIVSWLGLVVAAPARASSPPIRVFVTVADLGSLAEAVGGDQVHVTVMAKGTEDAHFVEAKPSFIKALSQSDLYVQIGMELEVGYAPLLLQNARNPAVLPGNAGFLDASSVIAPLEVPSVPIDRSMGDVHAQGNPHYLTDPLNGLKVARLISERLARLRPAQKAAFEARYDALRRRLGTALVGETLAAKYDAEKLALLFEYGKLDAFLRQQGDTAALAGWLGRMQPHRGAKVVDDHPLWAYFARRFGLEVVGHMEPKPGIPPTTSHLTRLVARMQAEGVAVVIAAPYYDPRHARFLAQATGARIAYLAHQVGSREGTGDYLGMIDYNVRTVAAALSGSG
jgi:ABC-type Zn uptake system ZnuABC Zn-binding protein ZnuA